MSIKKMKKQTDKNLRCGVLGCVCGACIGAPLIGAGVGLVYANKDKLKKKVKQFDNYVNR